MNNEPTVIDMSDMTACEMTAGEQKEFEGKTIMFIENDHETGMLRIAIPTNTLPLFTRERRVKMLTDCLADLVQKVF